MTNNETVTPPLDAPFLSHAAPVPKLKVIALKDVVVHPQNPRKHPGDVTELASSMAVNGVLQEPIVRKHPNPDGLPGTPPWQLLVGTRRRAAAELNGWPEMTFKVVNVDDRQALVMMLLENHQRADVPPLEEAEGYAALHADHDMDVAEIAAAMGVPDAHVARRLRLLTLHSDAQDLLRRGVLTLGGAHSLMMLEDLDDQAIALAKLYRPTDGTPVNASTVRSAVGGLLRVLAEAPWDKDDADLLPSAGACEGCPKNTVTQATLFDEGFKDPKARCTDSACFEAKRDAHLELVSEALKAQGTEVLTGADANEVFRKRHDSETWQKDSPLADGYRDVHEFAYDVDDGSKHIKAYLENAGIAPTRVLDPSTGRVREVVDKAAITKLKRLAKKDRKESTDPDVQRAKKTQARNKEREETMRHAFVGALAEKAKKAAVPEVLQVLVFCIWNDIDDLDALLARHVPGFSEGAKGDAAPAFIRKTADAFLKVRVPQMDTRDLLALLVEMVTPTYDSVSRREAAKRLGLTAADIKAHAKQMDESAAAAHAKKDAPAKKKGPELVREKKPGAKKKPAKAKPRKK